MLLSLLTTVTLALTVSASKLFVSSYAGKVVTLDLKKEGNGSHTLTQFETHNECAPNASWLLLDPKYDVLYCIEENQQGSNGSLHSFKFDRPSGRLTHIASLTIPAGPVHATIYTNPEGAQLLAVAHYTTALTTYTLSAGGLFSPLQQLYFTMDKPGPNPQQEKPHPHQVRLDPSHKYLVVPDLGADLLRVFYINPKNLSIIARKPFNVPPGSGPRHGDFYQINSPIPNNRTGQIERNFYYLVTELSNTLYSYSIAYLPGTGGLTFNPAGNSKTYTDDKASAFVHAYASEVITGDPLSVLVSNRNGSIFTITNPDPKNSTQISSDSLARFSIDRHSGAATLKAVTPAGGDWPRSFQPNKDGSLVAVGLQYSGRVVIYKRCPETGDVSDTILAYFNGLGEVTSVVWAD